MHEEIFELFACRWLWQRKPLFQMGKGSCQIVLRTNNSHTLCFQGPGSTVIRFSVELLVLLPGLVWRRFLGDVLRAPAPARLWGAAPGGCSMSQAEENPSEDQRGSGTPPSPAGTDSRTNNQVFLTRTAVLAAMCAHSPGHSCTSRRKRPEK